MLGTMSAQTIRFPITPTASLVVADLYFPLASAPAAFWSAVRADGGDIRVYMADGITPLPYQVAGFDRPNKLGSLFLPVSGCASFVIEAGTGQPAPAVDATYGQYNVWESALKLVMHGNDLNDSTRNQNNGTSAIPPTYAAAKVGNGLSFTTSQYVDLGDPESLRITGDMTIMAWVKGSGSASGLVAKVVTGSNKPAPFAAVLNGSGGIALQRGNGSLWGFYTSPTGEVSGAAFSHIGATMAGTAVQHYLNGATSGNAGTISTTIGNAADHLYLNNQYSGFLKFAGIMNEIRIYNRALAANEMAQHSAMQSNPAAFWTIGAAY